MSYILDALTKSQNQRERSSIPTLTTGYPIEESTRRPSNWRQWMTIGLASIAVFIAFFTMFSGRLEPVAQRSDPPAPLSVSRAGSTPTAAITEQAAYLPSAGADSSGASSSTSARPEKDGIERDATAIASVRVDDVTGRMSPTPGESASNATSEITGSLTRSPGKVPQQRLTPESRRLVDELMALRRDAEDGVQRTDTTSTSLQGPRPTRSRDSIRRPEQSGSPPPVSALAESTELPPNLKEFPLDTQAAIPPLKINVHAYAASSDERMVIINMKTYGEGDRLQEGPLIDAITPTGVVLIFNDQRFQLSAH